MYYVILFSIYMFNSDIQFSSLRPLLIFLLQVQDTGRLGNMPVVAFLIDFFATCHFLITDCKITKSPLHSCRPPNTLHHLNYRTIVPIAMTCHIVQKSTDTFLDISLTTLHAALQSSRSQGCGERSRLTHKQTGMPQNPMREYMHILKAARLRSAQL
jgi:hypothetical protein